MSKLHRPGPMDYLFLYAETARQPMHVGCLLLYKPPAEGSGEPDAMERFKGLLSFKDVIPPFNYRLVTRWGMPYWLENTAVDVAKHVHHIHLPRGSDQQALLDRVATLHERRMDRSLPLWQVWIISGLADGRYAVYWQMHHALLDGVSGVRMIARAHTTDSTEREMCPFWAQDPARKRSTALAGGLASQSDKLGVLGLGRRLFEAQAMAGQGL